MQILESGQISTSGYESFKTPPPLSQQRPYGLAVCTQFIAERQDESRYSFSFLDKHISRINASFQQWFKKPLLTPAAKIEEQIYLITKELFLRHNKIRNISIRIIASLEGVDLIFSEYSNPWRNSIRLLPIRCRRKNPEIKLSGDLDSLRARQTAIESGYQEALLLNSQNQITEGAWSNFFWFDKNYQLWTTNKSILPGITRKQIIDNFDCATKLTTLENLLEEVSEAFVTQATTGVTQVQSIGTKQLATNQDSKTKDISKWYKELIASNSERL